MGGRWYDHGYVLGYERLTDPRAQDDRAASPAVAHPCRSISLTGNRRDRNGLCPLRANEHTRAWMLGRVRADYLVNYSVLPVGDRKVVVTK